MCKVWTIIIRRSLYKCMPWTLRCPLLCTSSCQLDVKRCFKDSWNLYQCNLGPTLTLCSRVRKSSVKFCYVMLALAIQWANTRLQSRHMKWKMKWSMSGDTSISCLLVGVSMSEPHTCCENSKLSMYVHIYHSRNSLAILTPFWHALAVLPVPIW